MPRYRTYRKRDFPVEKVRRYLEPGPVVLLSAQHKAERGVMAMGWHMILESEPSLVGCYLWTENRTRALVRRSKACVINLPTVELIDAVIDVGNTHGGGNVDKFERFGLTAVDAERVAAPMIAECYASFECELVDASLVRKYSLFVFEVVKAHVAASPKYPTTVHYRGDGVFMVSGRNRSYRKRFKPQNL